MDKLQRAFKMWAATTALIGVAVVIQGVGWDRHVPFGAALFVGAILGAVAAALDAALRGNRVATENEPAMAMPGERLRHLRRAAAPVTEADRAFATAMVAGVVAQVDHEQDMIDARGSEPVVVRLRPRIPVGDAPVTSWLGGAPALPPGAVWPEQDGVRLTFLAQLDCAALPADLWDGLGPRHGALAVFAHPTTVAPTVLHLTGSLAPQPAIGAADACFLRPPGKDEAAHAIAAFPRWPIDLVTVRPGDNDPRAEAEEDHGDSPYQTGFDLTDPAYQPFDWRSTLAMLNVLERRIAYLWRPLPPGPNRLDEQLERTLAALAEAEAAPEPPANLTRLRNAAADLPELIRLAAEARAATGAARDAVTPIIAEARARAAVASFSPDEAAAIVDRLSAIEWIKLNRLSDPSRGEGAERFEMLRLPLTRHDKRASLWVHDFEQIRFELARHAYADDADRLTAPVRAHYEARWRAMAGHAMAGVGHVPFRYVHQFDADAEITLLELPTSNLLGWMWGDVDDLVLTMRKEDLAAGRWDRLVMQVTN